MRRLRGTHDSAALPRYALPMDEDRLFQHTTTLDQGANFLATRDGYLALLTPHDTIAEDWLRRHVGEEATWLGPTLAVELNYFPALAEAIIAAGFSFERDALPN